MRTILHIDFNSYFATVEQQANPRLRGKPIGVTGGDRMPTSPAKRGEERTVLGAASVEAKKFGVKTGMAIWEAKKLCPEIVLVRGDGDKYLACTKKFMSILKDYSPHLEIFSIDECFLEVSKLPRVAVIIAREIKQRIRAEVGEWITCSIGISYNKLMAKLAGSLYKPDGLVVIAGEEAAKWVLDRVDLDEICGIGPKIKKRLFNLGVRDFKTLRQVPKECLLASFKSYGEVLYNMARGIDFSPVLPFYEREGVKSISHRHTINHDTNNPEEIRQILFKICEMIAARLRQKKLVGKTVRCWFRRASEGYRIGFSGDDVQNTIQTTDDGLEIFNEAWRLFAMMWYGEKVRMVGASVSNLKPATPTNLPLFSEDQKKEVIFKAIDKVNNKFGDFTLQRATLLNTCSIKRNPQPLLSQPPI